MTLGQLRTLLAVVDCGSVRAAAERLVVSQPAVSGAIRSLERELGVDLLEPHGRGVRLTAAGEAFAASVRSSLEALDHGIRTARSVEDPARGAVRIAAIGTAAEQVLLPLLGRFRREHPDATISVEVGNRAAVWSALGGLGADLVVAGRPAVGTEAIVLGRAANTLVVVGRPPVSASRRDLLRFLGSTTWLLREEGSGTREATEELLGRLGLDPPRMILGSNGAVLEAVVADLGVALMSLAALRPGATGVVQIACPGTPIERPWHLAASGRAALSPTARLVARSLVSGPGGFTATAAGRRLLGV